MLAKTRDRPDILNFFKKAIGSSELPQKINIDKSGSNIGALKCIITCYLCLDFGIY